MVPEAHITDRLLGGSELYALSVLESVFEESDVVLSLQYDSEALALAEFEFSFVEGDGLHFFGLQEVAWVHAPVHCQSASSIQKVSDIVQIRT